MKSSSLSRNEQVLISKCQVARDFFSRFMGLMGRSTMPDDEALCFPKCNSIHTFFMRMPIDVVLVSKDGKVVDVVSSMKPWRLMAPRGGVKHIIEMRANRASELGIRSGEKLNCQGVWD